MVLSKDQAHCIIMEHVISSICKSQFTEDWGTSAITALQDGKIFTLCIGFTVMEISCT